MANFFILVLGIIFFPYCKGLYTSVGDTDGSSKFNLPTIRELPNCGRRFTRKFRARQLTELNGKLFGECFWDCTWKPNPYFSMKPEKIDTILGETATLDINNPGNHPDNPNSKLPKALVQLYRDIYGEDPYPNDYKIRTWITVPKIPEDTKCLRDCYPSGVTTTLRDEQAFEICRTSMIEQNKLSVFFECMILLNSQQIPPPLPRTGVSIAKDPFQTALEICYLAIYIDETPGVVPATYTGTYEKLYPDAAKRLGCWKNTLCTYLTGNPLCPILNPRKRNKNKTRNTSKFGKVTQKNRNKSRKKNNLNKDNSSKERRGPFNNSTYNAKELFTLFERTIGDDGDKLGAGATVYPVDTYDDINSRHHPWACSLRTKGFRGRHRCGVTLLSGPTEQNKDDPYVLVGAAHCNYICKDRDSGNILETCCCRPKDSPATCFTNIFGKEKSPFCTGRPSFVKAEPEDVDIVCGEYNTAVQIISQSKEDEQVFKITKITNHPHYKPNGEGIGVGGPIEGNDIAVYHVKTDYKLGDIKAEPIKKVDTDNDGIPDKYVPCNPAIDPDCQQCNENEWGTCDPIWPVCLPKDDDELTTSDKGMIAGWLDPAAITEFERGSDSSKLGVRVPLDTTIRLETYPRVMRLEKDNICQDPEYQRQKGVRTYFPPGTVCYSDPSEASCIDFGASGSGVVREWSKYDTTGDGRYQHSFVGPLSMSKGCDKALSVCPIDNPECVGDNIEFVYRGSNSLVATDATCFMPWIVAQYGLKLPKHYKLKEGEGGCFVGTGDKTDINQEVCYTGRGTQCNFNLYDQYQGRTIDKCELATEVGSAKNVYRCADTDGFYAACNNNCKGVDPNSIIGAGTAGVFASGFAATSLLGPMTTLALGGLGAVAGTQALRCDNPARPCRTIMRGCQPRRRNRRGQLVCPRMLFG